MSASQAVKKILHKPHFVRKKAHFTEAFHMRQFSNNLNLPVFLCFLYPAPCLSLSGLPGKRGGRGRKGNRNRGSKKIASGGGGGNGGGLVTCPGFAGYCSESYPGDTCLVVCAFGRNNVPVCQVRSICRILSNCFYGLKYFCVTSGGRHLD